MRGGLDSVTSRLVLQTPVGGGTLPCYALGYERGRSAPPRRLQRTGCALRRVDDAQMNHRPPGSSGVQWLNRRDMSVRTEDSITLCQRALQIVTELCLAGHVDREKCADIFPLESNIQGKGHAGKFNEIILTDCMISQFA